MYRHRAAAACGCAGGHYRVATRRLQPEADGRSRARQRNADGRGAEIKLIADARLCAVKAHNNARAAGAIAAAARYPVYRR